MAARPGAGSVDRPAGRPADDPAPLAPAEGRSAPRSFARALSTRRCRTPPGPAAYPHRPESVELRETHISWVFLAGEQAYKVKKPVRFPFLDYGTLERRRACCAAELRAQPALRPERLPRRGRARAARADGSRGGGGERPARRRVRGRDGPLRRVHDARRPASSATKRRTPTWWPSAAPSRASMPPRPSRPTAASTARGVVEETLDDARRRRRPGQRLAELARFCRAALAGFGPELGRRARPAASATATATCARSTCSSATRSRRSTASSSTASLRVADVGYDLAFLIMDVARRDDDLARALVRGYRAAGGDPGRDALLAFLCAVRALVRAKVDLLRAAQLTGAAGRRTNGPRAGAARRRRALRLARAAAPASCASPGWPPAVSRPSPRRSPPRPGGRSCPPTGSASCAPASTRTSARRRAPTATARAARVYAELAQRATAAVRRDGGVIVDATFRRDAGRRRVRGDVARRRDGRLARLRGAARGAAGARGERGAARLGLRRRPGDRRRRARRVSRSVHARRRRRWPGSTRRGRSPSCSRPGRRARHAPASGRDDLMTASPNTRQSPPYARRARPRRGGSP